MMQDKISFLKDLIQESNNIVFFGGAGVSTESGIPDFRSTDGLYYSKYDIPPEMILSHRFFISHTKEFYDFYHDKMIYTEVIPNITHLKLQELEHINKLRGIVTQNIDGLHQMAGSKKVLELHGSIHRNYCMTCGKSYGLDYVSSAECIPLCSCGGIIKPDVVLYEEALNQEVMEEAIMLIREADMLIVGGTSLSVYPAAGLLHYYKGDKLILINRTITSFDEQANLRINVSLGEVFSQL